jgi:hypothetical protein
MTNQSEWQEANRRLIAEQREKLGDPPTAEELLAFSRGELSETEQERIRDLLVAYPELARMYSAPFAEEEAQPGVPQDQIAAGLANVQRRLGGTVVPLRSPVRRYLPTSIAAALALLFFGLFVQAESRARDHVRSLQVPRILGAAQELDPDDNRGAATPIPLRKDGEAYLLEAHLTDDVRYPHYILELYDATGAIWTGHAPDAPAKNAFRIVIPHEFLSTGSSYQLRIFGIDGETRRPVGSYDVKVPSE